MNLPTPESVVERIRTDSGPSLLLLTGGRGSSKTRWCLALSQAAREAGLDVAGLVSPPVYTAGSKTGIDLVDVATDTRRRLAERPPPGLPGTAGLGWRFDAAVLAWGDAILARPPPCDLLLVDELGPLEFRGEGGFMAGFTTVDARRYRLAVVVIRPELLDAACRRWPWTTEIMATEGSLGLSDARL